MFINLNYSTINIKFYSLKDNLTFHNMEKKKIANYTFIQRYSLIILFYFDSMEVLNIDDKYNINSL